MSKILCLLALCLLIIPSRPTEDLSLYSNEKLSAIVASAQKELDVRISEMQTDASQFIYASNGNEIRINAYIGTDADVIIPSEINGLPVTMLHEKVFYANKSLTSIYIPDGITIIPDSAFYDCSNLNHVRLPKDLKIIERLAFSMCAINEVVILPETLDEIGEDAFDLTDITGLVISSSFTVKKGMFLLDALNKLRKLEFIYIKEGDNPVFSEDDFSDCPNLKIAIIPNSVTSLPEKAFEKSRFLKIITPSGSYAESFAKKHFISVETDTYNEYASLYNSMYPD